MIFNENNINCIDSVKDWTEAIKKASHSLLSQGYINENYIVSMIKNIEKYGFYIVLDEYVAMPHSRPEDGVIKSSVSLLKINNAVMFGTEKVKIVCVLAAKNSEKHIDIIKEIMNIIENEEKKEAILSATTKEEIIEILK